MANPNTYDERSADIDAVTLHLVSTIGGSGAVGTVSRSKEFNATTPLTHVSTGLYRLTTREAWAAILNHCGNNQQATYAFTGACDVRLKTFSLSAGTFDFECRRGDTGALVDPASGDTLRFTLEMQKTQP